MAGNEKLEVANRELPTLFGGNHPATWRESLLAGLPHAAIATLQLLVTLQLWVTPETGVPAGSTLIQTLEIAAVILAVILVVVLVGMLVYAWRGGWPRWSGSYYLYGFILLAAPALFLLQVLDTQWAHRGMSILLGLVYILMLVGLVYWVVQRDALKGLLMLAPIAILSWWPVLEFIPGEIRNPLELGMLLVITLMTVTVARVGDWRLGIWVLLAGCLVIGLPISYFRTYFHAIPVEYAGPGNWVDFSGRYTQAAFWSLLLVLGPMLLWVLRQLSRTSEDRWIYPVMVATFFVNLGCNLVLVRGYLMGWWDYHPAREWLLAAIILLSALVYTLGVIRILLVALRADHLEGGWSPIFFGFAAAGLPWLFLLPMFEVRRYAPTVLPFGLFYENSVPDLWVYGPGVIWLVVGIRALTGLQAQRGTQRERAG